MSRRPDAVTSSILRPVVKDEPVDANYDEEDDDDPIVRTIDVFISPALSNTLHLLQFPIEPAHRNDAPNDASDGNERHVKGSYNSPSPIEAKYRPRHNMLELEYPLPHIPSHNRQLPDKMMCLSSRTNASNSIGLSTHMALARMNESGTRLDVVPLRRHVLQMRPTFDHLHDNDDDDGGGGDDNDDLNNNAGINDDTAASSTTTKAKPIMYARKETDRSAVARRSTYAHKKASEASEEWITLDVHGSEGQWSAIRKETLARVKCAEKEKTLRLATIGHENDEDGRGAGYVKSLNYLDSSGGGSGGAGANFVENLSEWAPSFVETTDYNDNVEMTENDDGEVVSVSASERATAELAAKLAVLMQNGSGTMIPYCVIRSLFHASKVSDDMLTVALSSCAVLVRGNFALKSILAKFLTSASTTGAGGGGGVTKLKLLRRMRDLILLLLNMHGMVGRQRLIKAFSEYDSIIDPDTITFVLKTVARQSHNMSRNCWVAKVDDDENFALDFPEVAACHAMYWTKKEEMLADLINLYEDAD